MVDTNVGGFNVEIAVEVDIISALPPLCSYREKPQQRQMIAVVKGKGIFFGDPFPRPDGHNNSGEFSRDG